MKKFLFLFTGLLPMLIVAQNFQGAITMKSITTNEEDPSENSSSEVLFIIKDNLVGMVPVDGSDEKSAQSGKMIFDREAKKVSMLMDQGGKKMRIEMPWEPYKSEDSDTDGEPEGTVTITDETKEIREMECLKVIMEDEEEISEAWITSMVGINYLELVNIMTQGKKDIETGDEKMDQLAATGFPLEITSENRKTGEKNFIEFFVDGEYDVDSFFTILDEYPLMNMGDMIPGFGK